MSKKTTKKWTDSKWIGWHITAIDDGTGMTTEMKVVRNGLTLELWEYTTGKIGKPRWYNYAIYEFDTEAELFHWAEGFRAGVKAVSLGNIERLK